MVLTFVAVDYCSHAVLRFLCGFLEIFIDLSAGELEVCVQHVGDKRTSWCAGRDLEL